MMSCQTFETVLYNSFIKSVFSELRLKPLFQFIDFESFRQGKQCKILQRLLVDIRPYRDKTAALFWTKGDICISTFFPKANVQLSVRDLEECLDSK